MLERAQMMAQNLNQNIKNQADVAALHFQYRADIYSAIKGEKVLFQVTKTDLDYNSSTPEGLMNAWIANLNSVLKNSARVVEKNSKPVMKEQAKVNPEPVKPVAKVEQKLQQEQTAEVAPKEEAQETPAMETGINPDQHPELANQVKAEELELIRHEALLYKQTAQKIESFSKIFALMFVIQILVIFIIIYLLFKIFKLGKNYEEVEQISSVNRIEELENSVSALIKELEEKSKIITEEASRLLEELNSKIGATRDKVAPINNVSPPPPSQEVKVEIPEIKALEDEILAVSGEIEELSKMQDVIEAEQTPLETIPEPKVEIEVPPVLDDQDDLLANLEKTEQAEEEIAAMGDILRVVEKDEAPKPAADNVSTTTRSDEETQDLVRQVYYDDSLPKQKKIMKLIEADVDKELIAKTFEIGLGEVDLIIELNK